MLLCGTLITHFWCLVFLKLRNRDRITLGQKQAGDKHWFCRLIFLRGFWEHEMVLALLVNVLSYFPPSSFHVFVVMRVAWVMPGNTQSSCKNLWLPCMEGTASASHLLLSSPAIVEAKP